MTGEAPAVDPFDVLPDAPADFLATATAHLMLAATGNDVAGNLDAALRTILTAASRPDTRPVPCEAVELARLALVAVADAAVERLGDHRHDRRHGPGASGATAHGLARQSLQPVLMGRLRPL
ncbi:hypothetical protein FV222_06760 [Methylobacterium sp. WL103]|uniref:hypothetical protein n=1 Tax=Methylobacterium sp. WL103 TaxID=2603891 RepID=UPI0011C9848A|nr:hypothetical protein [Methylobacterium sp. WL103]TXN05311.1 hypothetical protein FV222_06760 [Methylobacterium sp. WL103]